MLWIDEAETEVLSPVDLEWLADQKGQGHLCALVPCPDWQSLHRHGTVLMPVVWDPWGLVYCGCLTSDSQWLLQ